MRGVLAMLLVPSLVMAATPRKPHRIGPVSSAREAKAIAEQETSGIAVSARRIHLNGATGGWEVDVHMPREARGWHCIVDNDTHAVFTKDRIPNPKLPHRKP